MARPSNKEIEKRNKIIEVGVFKRDNEIYTKFEDFLKLQDDSFVHPYYFCRECEKRDIYSNNFYKDMMKARVKKYSNPKPPFSDEEIVQYGMITGKNEIIEKNSFHEQLDKYYKLKLIDDFLDDFISQYFLYLAVDIQHSYQLYFKDEYKNYKNKGYVTSNDMNKDILKNAVSKERYNYFNSSYGNNLRLELIVEKSFAFDEPLSDEEKNNIIEELNKYDSRPDKTLVHRHPLFHEIDAITNNKNKNIYAELDLTKPLDEILSYVTRLKKDFDEDPSKFPNAYELLGETQTPYKCDLDKCEIYKDTRSPKPISGRLADILFIYDCKKVNELAGADLLTNDYITDEINSYWRNVKNISTERFYSLSEYYAIAKEYIDDKRYVEYLTGVSKPPL